MRVRAPFSAALVANQDSRGSCLNFLPQAQRQGFLRLALGQMGARFFTGATSSQAALLPPAASPGNLLKYFEINLYFFQDSAENHSLTKAGKFVSVNRFVDRLVSVDNAGCVARLKGK